MVSRGKTKGDPCMNEKGTWGIVDEQGNLVEEFRCKFSADQYLPRLKKKYFDRKLNVKRMKGGNKNIDGL